MSQVCDVDPILQDFSETQNVCSYQRGLGMCRHTVYVLQYLLKSNIADGRLNRIFTFRNVIAQNLQKVNRWVVVAHFQDGSLLQVLWFPAVKEVVKLACL